MGNGNDIINSEKQKINILNEDIHFRDFQVIVQNVTKLKTRSKGKRFKNLSLQEERKLKLLLANAQIFEQAEIEGVKREKKNYKIFWKLKSLSRNLLCNNVFVKQIF